MKDKQEKIAAVIVTFNRKQCLLECVQAIFRQTYPPKTTYIIDNASTDGTLEYLSANGVKLKENEAVLNGNILVHYIRLSYNIGGAGGFYYGIKTAYEQNIYDAVWVMDDDGIPMDNCLEMMVPYLTNHDYISPICIAKENPDYLAFDHKGEPIVKKYIEAFSKDGIIIDDGFPFNGVMYSRHFIDTIGFPKKELFIWGDEANYSKRARKAGFSPITVTNAIHYHPFNRADYAEVSILGHKRKIIITDSLLRFYCMHRNAAYNARIDGTAAIKNLVVRYAIFTKYYLCISHRPSLWLTFNRAFLAGLIGYLGGHKKYLKK